MSKDWLIASFVYNSLAALATKARGIGVVQERVPDESVTRSPQPPVDTARQPEGAINPEELRVNSDWLRDGQFRLVEEGDAGFRVSFTANARTTQSFSKILQPRMQVFVRYPDGRKTLVDSRYSAERAVTDQADSGVTITSGLLTDDVLKSQFSLSPGGTIVAEAYMHDVNRSDDFGTVKSGPLGVLN